MAQDPDWRLRGQERYLRGARILHDLDAGHIEAARSLLRSQLDSDVITIWAFSDYSDLRSRKMVTNVLTGIATFRAEYPSNYMSRTSGYEVQIDAKIASILERARKEQSR